MRQNNAHYFDDHLNGVEIPYAIPRAKHVYHQYTVKSKNRGVLMENLKKNEIDYGIYYPQPLHTYTHLKKYAHKDLIISELLANEVISLPVHPALKSEDLQRIVSVVNEVSK